MRRARWIALILLAAACGGVGDGGGPNGDMTATSVGPSTTDSGITTTTSGATQPDPTSSNLGSEELRRGTEPIPGIAYVYDSENFPSFTMTVALDGWKLAEVGEQFAHFENDSDDAGPGVWAAVVAFQTNDSLDQLAAYFLDDENQDDFVEPVEIEVGGLPARQIDVLIPPREPLGDPSTGPANYDGDLRCSQRVVFVVEQNVPSVAPRPWTQGLVGCAWNRVVIVDVAGTSMLLTVSPDERSFNEINRLSELGPYVNDFINAITFCTEESRCDD